MVDIKSFGVVSVAMSKVGSRIEDVPELSCLEVESNDINTFSLPELMCDVTAPDEYAASDVALETNGVWFEEFDKEVADSV